MDSKAWKLLAALSMLPVATALGAQASATPLEPWSIKAEEATGVWTFYHEQVLGTSLEIRVRAANRAIANEAERVILATFDREELIFSAWHPESEFSKWEKTRFEAVPVSEDMFTVLAAFDRWREVTDGSLDPSVETAMRLWQRTTAEGRTPTQNEINIAKEAMKQPHWSLDAESRTAMRLSDAPLALASFTKSWIIEKAANAALASGVSGILLNVGGDVVARGDLSPSVDITDPFAVADNELPADRVVIRDRAVATSGGYWRGFSVAPTFDGKPEYSHLFDPRSACPVDHVLSSTVIARDAETAGALATAFSVMPVSDSQRLAATIPGVDYLLITADGQRVQSRGWIEYQSPQSATFRLKPASFVFAARPSSTLWNSAFELVVGIELPRIADARYRRPYVAVWIEDADHYPVRTLALWTENPRWLPDLKQWYRDDQLRNLSEGTDISRTVGSATRPPGKYLLKWDGKDNEGKSVKVDRYTIVVEAAREHGGYEIQRYPMIFSGKPAAATIPAGKELGTITLDYRKR